MLDKKKLIVFSLLHLLCGVICILIETIKVSSTFHEQTLSTFGEGFYCGAVFMLTGLFDLMKKPGKKTFEKISFSLKILSSIAGGWMLLLSGESKQ